MKEIVRCLRIILNTSRMLRFMRFLFLAVTGVLFIRIIKSVLCVFKGTNE